MHVLEGIPASLRCYIMLDRTEISPTDVTIIWNHNGNELKADGDRVKTSIDWYTGVLELEVSKVEALKDDGSYTVKIMHLDKVIVETSASLTVIKTGLGHILSFTFLLNIRNN